MVPASIIFLISSILLILAILFKNEIKIKNRTFQTFYLVPFFFALISLVFKIVPFDYVKEGIFNEGVMNPLKILILFLSMSFLSICLDAVGFFSYLASLTLARFKESKIKLFISLYILIAFLTVFTSNDIVILTFTPFICYYAKNAKINPIPLLVMEFVTANTYSMLLQIGNPTNIYLSQSFGISFGEYFANMWLSALGSGIVSFILILLIFRKDLFSKCAKINVTREKINNKGLTIVFIFSLSLTTILLALSNILSLPMYLLAFFGLLFNSLVIIIYCFKNHDYKLLKDIYKRVPYNLVLFVLSMFVLVSSLKYNNVSSSVLGYLNSHIHSPIGYLFCYGIGSTLFDNLINNIPMSILFATFIDNKIALYASIIGSNIGAFLSPLGALAGIMWMSILKNQNIKFSFLDFCKYGVIIAPLTLVSSLLLLLV